MLCHQLARFAGDGAGVDVLSELQPRSSSGSGLLFQGPLRRTSPRELSSLYMPTANTATPIAMSASLIQR
jgi:hypothetical protein